MRNTRSMTVLDAVDIAIINTLQRDGRMTNAELGDRVGLSPSAALRRVRRLEDAGVIAGYVALVDPRAIGRTVSVFVEVSLHSQAEELLDEFEATIRAAPEVMSCHLMAGDADYLVHVVCVDVADYERIHRQHLASLPHVSRLKSSFAIREVCARTDFEL
jgi:Lrp/AsnC family leucine-responsive transcriptional regulator